MFFTHARYIEPRIIRRVFHFNQRRHDVQLIIFPGSLRENDHVGGERGDSKLYQPEQVSIL